MSRPSSSSVQVNVFACLFPLPSEERVRLTMEPNLEIILAAETGKQKKTQEGRKVSQAAVELGYALQRDHMEKSRVVVGGWLVSPR